MTYGDIKNDPFPVDIGPESDPISLTESSESSIRIFSGNRNQADSSFIYDVSGEYGLIAESLQNNIFTFESYTKDKYGSYSSTSSQLPFFSQSPLHKHNFSEIGIVLDGIVCQNVNGNHLTHRAGQGFILNRNTLHTEEFVNDFHIIYLELPEDALSRIIQRNQVSFSAYPFSDEIHYFFLPSEEQSSSSRMLLTFSPADPSSDIFVTVRSILEQICQEMRSQKPGYSDLCDGMVLRLLSILDDETLYQKDFYRSDIRTPELAFNALTDYLERKYGRLSRKDLEAELHYSSGYLNKVCKMYTGKSLVEYGQYFSMKEAERLLLKTDLSVSEIVTRLGYTNRHYFNQVFRAHFSVSPSQHRENHGQTLHMAE